MGILEWLVVTLIVVTTANIVIGVGTARNVARLMSHEAAKMDQEYQQWHARNVTYKDAFMANEAPLSDGANIPQLRG